MLNYRKVQTRVTTELQSFSVYRREKAKKMNSVIRTVSLNLYQQLSNSATHHFIEAAQLVLFGPYPLQWFDIQSL
jgi:hypothetical protein